MPNSQIEIALTPASPSYKLLGEPEELRSSSMTLLWTWSRKTAASPFWVSTTDERAPVIAPLNNEWFELAEAIEGLESLPLQQRQEIQEVLFGE